MAHGQGRGPAIDFALLARVALDRARQLVPQWLPGGKVVGHEYTAAAQKHGGPGDSWSVNLASGAWAHFAGDEAGNDLVSLYAALNGLKQGEAARALARELGVQLGADVGPAPPAPPAVDDHDAWHDAGAWPADGPVAPVAHTYRGRPAARWAYHDAGGNVIGYACRFVTSDGSKDIIPLTWSKHPTKGLAWRWRAFDEPRPLFNWPALVAADSQKPVLIVEGEKCAALAQPLLDDWAVTTWPGGSKAWNKANWLLLTQRNVVIWPDCDAKRDKSGALWPEAKQPGMRCAEQIAQRLQLLGCSVELVQIPAPDAVVDGWDIADAIAEAGEDAPNVVRSWLAKLRPPSFSVVGGTAPPTPPGAHGAAQANGGGGGDKWSDALIWERGKLVKHVANVALILRHDERWADVIAFDEFAQLTLKRKAPPFARGRTGEWDADDDTRTAVWLAEFYRLDVTSATVTESIEMIARERRFHPVREHLRSLVWDGVPRAEEWLIRYCNVDDSEYARTVATLFLRGMVARVMQPGCKFDYCLVLEGAEGLRKSTLARTLGLDWGSDTPLDLQNNREAASALHGRWVMEFAEMESVTRAEAHLQKSFLSRQFDQYRPVYSRRNIKVPRQCVFIGTTNETEYIKEGQGARRFWPVTVGAAVDIAGLSAVLAQLLAEAVVQYDAGERWYPSDAEQANLFREQQMARVVQESLVDALHDWVLEPSPDELHARATHDGMFSLADAAFRCLKVSWAQLTRDLQIRVGKALSALGCQRIEKRNGMTRFWYKAPHRNAPRSGHVRPVHSAEEARDDAIPF